MNKRKKPQQLPTAYKRAKAEEPERPLATIVCNPFFESKMMQQFGGDDKRAHWYWSIQYRRSNVTASQLSEVCIEAEIPNVRLVLDVLQDLPFPVTLRIWTFEPRVRKLLTDTARLFSPLARLILDYARHYVMTREELDSTLKNELLDRPTPAQKAKLGLMDQNCKRLAETFPLTECWDAIVIQRDEWTNIHIATREWLVK